MNDVDWTKVLFVAPYCAFWFIGGMQPDFSIWTSRLRKQLEESMQMLLGAFGAGVFFVGALFYAVSAAITFIVLLRPIMTSFALATLAAAATFGAVFGCGKLLGRWHRKRASTKVMAN